MTTLRKRKTAIGPGAAMGQARPTQVEALRDAASFAVSGMAAVAQTGTLAPLDLFMQRVVDAARAGAVDLSEPAAAGTTSDMASAGVAGFGGAYDDMLAQIDRNLDLADQHIARA